ncbi:hypothetical protein B1759_14470 [Rubrivirga sp. SAORIC476]|uniref:PAS domain-containing protein n=1 Tax=Rubrivirga sp. SAORIC476 TaxID=1961794 RepID=UPI000BA9BC11|nr:PAS domain-containing protein [Rubrivirga sp. SAORIC476]PAP79524.1 hypothetical protein B1759_14470 [Rubrivirga sp. SAORIC476]
MSSSSRRPSAVVQAFRWLLLMGALTTFGFWWMYQVVGPSPHDMLWLRAVMASPFLAILAGTYTSEWVRRHVWWLALGASAMMNAYFSTLAVLSGFGEAWTIAILTATSAAILALASYARKPRHVWVAAVVNLTASSIPLFVLGADGLQTTLTLAYAGVLATLISFAAVSQVRTRHAYRAQRDAAAAQGRLLRTVIDAIPQHVYVKDREGRCLIRNRYSAEQMGFDDPEEAVGLTVFDQSEDPQVAADYWAQEDRVMRAGEPDLDHEEPYAFDGQTGWVVTSRVPLRDDTGAVVGLVGVTRDVTEQKTARAVVLEAKEAAEAREAEVAEQRALLRTVIDTIPDHIYVKDREGRATLRNLASARSLGYETPEDAVGYADSDVDADLGALTRADDLYVIETGAAIRDKEEQALGGGWLLTTKVPLRDRDGAVTGLVGVSRDITAQREAKAALVQAKEAAEARGRALAEQRQLLQTLIDEIPDAIYILDNDRRFLALNRGAAYCFGHPAEEIVGRTPDELFAPALAKSFRQSDESLLAAEGDFLRTEHDFTLPSGQTVRAVTSRFVTRDASGAVAGLVGVSRDVTADRAAQKALIEAKEAAEAATRAKSEFLANMSHEIRTPMNGVIGMTSLLLDTALDREQHDFVETIRSSGEALLTIINDILDFSKIEAGMLDLDVQPFDIRTCVEAALDLVAQPAAEKGVELAYLVEDGVPRTVRGDVTRVRQVLVNLLSNAVKFTHEGSVCVRVDAAPHDAEAGTTCEVEFAVEDTGIGIAPDKMDLVFESFSQADASTTRKYGGTGLGLTICRRLVDMMGGTMEAESRLGQGSTFRFSMKAEVAPSERRVFLRREQPVLQGRRVLIVDDNDVNREILTRLASRWRMVPDAVASGAAAIDTARAAMVAGRPYDLVLLDMQMPEMNGVDTAHALRALAPDAPPVMVMLTSINREGGLREETRAAGITAVLYKPTKPSQLYDILIDAFDGRPAAAAPQAQGSTSWISRAQPAAALRILLAEDNVVNQKVAVRLLDRLGCAVDVVSDGAEAVAAVVRQADADTPYDLVFMDVQMPVMDGLEATRAIRQAAEVTQAPYIVALTANAMQGDREECLAAGADDYLAKPVQLDSMQAALDRALAARRASRETA